MSFFPLFFRLVLWNFLVFGPTPTGQFGPLNTVSSLSVCLSVCRVSFSRKRHIGFPWFFAWMLVLGSVKKWLFFSKTRKLNILGAPVQNWPFLAKMFKCVKHTRRTPHDSFFIFKFVNTCFNLEYFDLCKFKLFDEPLQRGLVILLYIYIVV